MDTTQAASRASQPPALGLSMISGFWRRVGALFIDLMLLGAVGWAIGTAFFDPLARMGDWAKLIGFVIALAYFGPGNSRLTGGQTAGKRLLGLRVVDGSGQALSVPRALIRYVVLGVPFFANGSSFNADLTFSPLGYLLSLVVLGGIISILYLYIFNRRTRQSLHDLAVGSYVIRADPAVEHPAFLTLWPGHRAVVAALIVLALGAPWVASRVANSTTFAGILPLYQMVVMQPHVLSAQVMRGWSSTNGIKSHGMQAVLRLDAPMTEDGELAKNTAQLMAKSDPNIATEDSINVTLVYGFNLGIASGWRKHGYLYQPDDLK